MHGSTTPTPSIADMRLGHRTRAGAGRTLQRCRPVPGRARARRAPGERTRLRGAIGRRCVARRSSARLPRSARPRARAGGARRGAPRVLVAPGAAALPVWRPSRRARSRRGCARAVRDRRSGGGRRPRTSPRPRRCPARSRPRSARAGRRGRGRPRRRRDRRRTRRRGRAGPAIGPRRRGRPGRRRPGRRDHGRW